MLTPRQQHCLRGIGITRWQERSSVVPMTDEFPVSDSLQNPDVLPASSPAEPQVGEHAPVSKPVVQPVAPPTQQQFDVSDWPPLLDSIEACRNCALADSCTRKVPGKGFEQAELMIIGEAPGHEEDLQGKPFVGRAGQLLDKMMMAIDLDPKKVYITNILKCRPPNNRDPRPEEIQACSQFLRAQIALIKPRVIFSVGRISAQNLLQNSTPVGKLRGIQHVLPATDIPLLVTYHPAYLLRNPAEKARVWQDLKTLRRLLNHAAD